MGVFEVAWGKAGNLGLGIYMCRRGVVVPVYPAAFRRGVLQDDVLRRRA